MSGTYALPVWHQDVLGWFELNAGRTFLKRPFDEGLAVKVTSAQKGIWKSGLSPYAISVVQTPKGVYADQDPIFHSDGTWRYFYHQQGQSAAEVADPKRVFANTALFKCRQDRVPVGVVIPAESGKGYQVLGLAFVEGHSRGYFELVGPVSVGAVSELRVAEPSAASSAALIGFPIGAFDPNAIQDNRLKVIAEVRRRQGGARFRSALLQAYDARCAMTRYDATPALEAAHILPYRGPQTNHVANGLLLRADMHDLFDLGLIAVDTSAMRLLLARELIGTEYENYADASLWIPHDSEARPNVEALDMHRGQSMVA
jgi:putative restriction endonuclease